MIFDFLKVAAEAGMLSYILILLVDGQQNSFAASEATNFIVTVNDNVEGFMHAVSNLPNSEISP